MSITVGEILRDKGNQVLSTAPDATVYEALQLMAQKDVGALLVMERSRLVGIFSERDYARRLVLRGKFSKSTAVREVMTEDVLTVSPSDGVEQCMDVMTRRRIRHLPVVERDAVVGVISIGDLVKAVISDQRFTIGVLEQYITGSK